MSVAKGIFKSDHLYVQMILKYVNILLLTLYL